MDLVPNHQKQFAIHQACIKGQIQEATALLADNPRLATRRDDDDRLPLHWAASHNRLTVVELLAETPSFDVDAPDGAGWTALMMAASLPEGDGDDMVDVLLSKGADVTLTNRNGQTALHFAASKANLHVARTLIQRKASTRIKDRRGQLPLHRAAAVGSVPIVNLLLENLSPLNVTDVDGCSALAHAIAEGHGDAAVVLLKAGADTDRKDTTGTLPIDLAPDPKIRSYILRAAEEEGIKVTMKT